VEISLRSDSFFSLPVTLCALLGFEDHQGIWRLVR
jgi:hypothetical protein